METTATNTNTQKPRLALFGLGYVGSRLAEAASADGWFVDAWSRSDALGQGYTCDLGTESALKSLVADNYRADALVVTVPADVPAPVTWQHLHRLAKRRILYGTTGIYDRQTDSRERLTEGSPVKPDHKRLDAECGWMDQGGVVMRLSGIYGPGRSPADWIQRGRVGYEDRQVNLVHVADICQLTLNLCDYGNPQPLYNLADGAEHTWAAIIDHLVQAGCIEHDRIPKPRNGRKDAFVDPARILADIGPHRFRAWRSAVVELATDSANSHIGPGN